MPFPTSPAPNPMAKLFAKGKSGNANPLPRRTRCQSFCRAQQPQLCPSATRVDQRLPVKAASGMINSMANESQPQAFLRFHVNVNDEAYERSGQLPRVNRSEAGATFRSRKQQRASERARDAHFNSGMHQEKRTRKETNGDGVDMGVVSPCCESSMRDSSTLASNCTPLTRSGLARVRSFVDSFSLIFFARPQRQSSSGGDFPHCKGHQLHAEFSAKRTPLCLLHAASR